MGLHSGVLDFRMELSGASIDIKDQNRISTSKIEIEHQKLNSAIESR